MQMMYTFSYFFKDIYMYNIYYLFIQYRLKFSIFSPNIIHFVNGIAVVVLYK